MMTMRFISAVALLLVAGGASAQQPASVTGSSSLTGASSLGARSQFTNVWAFSPPNSTNDNTWFRGAVMPQPQVAGVSLIIAWSRVETGPPQAAPPCSTGTAPDQQQVDAIGMYHCYDWSTYDSTTAGNLVMQWFDSFGGSPKLVNLLFSGISTGTLNNTTPNYVTTSSWYNNPGFPSPYNRQDVVNTVKDCSLPLYAGTTASAGNVSWSMNTVTVTATSCCSTDPNDQSNAIHSGDPIFVSGSATGINSISGATAFNVTSNSFQYTSQGSAGTPSSVTYISGSQSWPVPYEMPYQTALQAFWAAALAHYGPTYSKFRQLNYFRFGGSAGSEWYPYCATSSLTALASPYTYVKYDPAHGVTGTWLGYYSTMLDYLQGLQPRVPIIMSINSAETGPINYGYADQEAAYAVQRVNGNGVPFGFGSQGLSAQDYVNCTAPKNCAIGSTTPSASDWYPLFNQYRGLGTPLELQTLSLSYEGDTDCTAPTCGAGNGKYSGDLPTFLYPFAINAGLTDVELYWRDLELAYDVNNYCGLVLGQCSSGSSISLGGQITAPLQLMFFNTVGQGPPQVTNTCTAAAQAGSAGDCSYAANINSTSGAH